MMGRDFETLVAGLRALGVRRSQDLLVHSSLRGLGRVEGGARTVLAALRATAGSEATIVVPTHTAHNSLSSRDFRAASEGLSAAELAQYIADMPGFDPVTTPSSGMGVFAEYVRTSPGAVRSTHPQTSFAALGPRAAECASGHALDCHLGEFSPLGWLDRRRAAVLLLGVGYAACTAFHLAEYRLPGERPHCTYRCFTMEHGVRQEQKFRDVDLIDSDFDALGSRMDQERFVRRGRVGAVDCRLIQMRNAVDFAVSCPSFRQRRSVADLDHAITREAGR
jgi:aminoglycoside 3-N-acetyltransferase